MLKNPLAQGEKYVYELNTALNPEPSAAVADRIME